LFKLVILWVSLIVIMCWLSYLSITLGSDTVTIVTYAQNRLSMDHLPEEKYPDVNKCAPKFIIKIKRIFQTKYEYVSNNDDGIE